MVAQPKKPAAAKPATAPKPTAKLVPRPATKKAAAPAAEAQAAPVAAAQAKPVRKQTKVQQTVAKHQEVLAEALEKAQAIRYDEPAAVMADAAAPSPKAATSKATRADKPAKPEKPAKPKKLKLVRDSYAMPEAEYARIGELKKRLAALGNEVKKSEVLRAGIAALAVMDDKALQSVMAGVERIKTGRPAK